MTKRIDDGGPAFPFGQTDAETGHLVNGWGSEGMTLRDYFAAKVCAAMATPTSGDTDFINIEYQHEKGGPTIAERVAAISYAMADAMLAARNKGIDDAT